MAERNQNEGKHLNWKDTWKDNTVQLAALGAITVGAGSMAINGNFNNAVMAGSRGIKAMNKGLDNYMTRRASPGAKLVYQVGKGTFKNLTRMPGKVKSGDELLWDRVSKNLKVVDTDPTIQARIREETARRLSGAAGSQRKVDSVLNGKGLPNIDEEQHIREIYESVRQEELRKMLNMDEPRPNRQKNLLSSAKKPMFEKGEVKKRLVVDGLGGMAFAAGLTGVHALDRTLNSKPDEKSERTFNLAGSFMNSKEDERMKKTANAVETYNRLKQIGSKAPDALASGVGYTGASLLTAGVLGSDPRMAKDKDGEKKNTGPRVIIELGEEDPSQMTNAGPGVGMSLPKLASKQSESLDKVALKLPDFKSFARNFKGYDKEINDLKNANHSDAAAERLKDQDIDSLLKQRYGNMVNEKTTPAFTNRLMESETDAVRQEAMDKAYELESLQAGARLKGGAAALAAGGGLAGMAAMKRKEEQQHA